MPHKTQSWLAWLDQHIMLLLAGFLLAFIPLMPKIPLWSPIEQYIVRIRLEDLCILFSAVVFAVQVLRRKVKWLSPMFFFVVAYAVAGFLSTVIAIFLLKTVPDQPLHIGKTVLHFFRYLEYFSLFFIAFSAIKSRKDTVKLLAVFCATVLLVTIYGYGQKFFYWPVYSTMNREFSKGQRLYLTEFARVQSTFGGHYDMSAFLVVALPLILVLGYRSKKRWVSTALHITFWSGTWLLIMSASRTPFAAYLVGLGLALALSTLLLNNTWPKRIWFGFSRGLVAALCLTTLVFYFGADMIDRLSNVVKTNQKVGQFADTLNSTRKIFISDQMLAYIPTAAELRKMLPQTRPPENATATDDAETIIAKQIASESDIPPKPFVKPSPTPAPDGARPSSDDDQVPADVHVIVPDEVTVATTSPTGVVTTRVEKRPRVYSQCALEKELSLCIRLETLWPRAIEGFLTNPVTGSGYATLTKESLYQFTEADSTDNNYLRTLGETGVLGFVTFYGSVAVVLFFAVRNFTSEDQLKKALSIGLFCGSVGLLLNAVYIDVFASSKVAQTYWALAGIFLGYVYRGREKSTL